MTKQVVIIWDSINNLVWVDGQKGLGGESDKGVYGKDARRFKAGFKEQKEYALKLAKKYDGVVYDRYYGVYLNSKEKTRGYRKSAFGGVFG